MAEYNKEVLQIFSHYFMCITTDVNEKFGEEKSLPFSHLNVQPENINEAGTQGNVLFVLFNIFCRDSPAMSVPVLLYTLVQYPR